MVDATWKWAIPEIRRGLARDEHRLATAIVDAANAVEGLDLPLGFGDQVGPEGIDSSPARQYTAYAGNVLVGIANVQPGDEPEVLIVVDPSHRRRGVGRALLQTLREDYWLHGSSHVLLVADERSVAGKAFMSAVGAEFRFAEHAMTLDPVTIDRSRPRLNTLALRTASIEDEDLLVGLVAAAFGDPDEETRAFLAPLMRAANRRFWMVTLAGEPIGTVAIVWSDDSVGVTTFGIVPAHRGHGFGRQILVDLIDMLLAEGWREITIEVATENRNALGLYRSCGFQEAMTFGYYRL